MQPPLFSNLAKRYSNLLPLRNLFNIVISIPLIKSTRMHSKLCFCPVCIQRPSHYIYGVCKPKEFNRTCKRTIESAEICEGKIMGCNIGLQKRRYVNTQKDKRLKTCDLLFYTKSKQEILGVDHME